MTPEQMREQIHAARHDPKLQKVEVPAWNTTVYIKELNNTEIDAFRGSFMVDCHNAIKSGTAESYKPNLRARILHFCICNEHGQTIFLPSDEEWLGKWPACELDHLVIECYRLNRSLAPTKGFTS